MRDNVGECTKCAERIICRVGFSFPYRHDLRVDKSYQNCSMWDCLSSLLGGRHRRLCSVCSIIPLAHDIIVCRCQELIYLCELCATWWQYRDTKYKEIWQTYDRINHTIGLYKVKDCDSPQDILFPATLRCWRGAQCLGAKSHFPEEQPPTELPACANMSAGMSLERTETDSQSSGMFGEENRCERISNEEGNLSRSSPVSNGAFFPNGTVLAPDNEDAGDFMSKEYRREVRSWCGWCNHVIMSSQDEAEHEAGTIE